MAGIRGLRSVSSFMFKRNAWVPLTYIKLSTFAGRILLHLEDRKFREEVSCSALFSLLSQHSFSSLFA
jgi:hypothetical protein